VANQANCASCMGHPQIVPCIHTFIAALRKNLACRLGLGSWRANCKRHRPSAPKIAGTPPLAWPQVDPLDILVDLHADHGGTLVVLPRDKGRTLERVDRTPRDPGPEQGKHHRPTPGGHCVNYTLVLPQVLSGSDPLLRAAQVKPPSPAGNQ